MKRFIFLGDSSGNLCPSLRFKERSDRTQEELICKDPFAIKVEIPGWSDREDLEQVLVDIEKHFYGRIISSHCKLQTIYDKFG